MRILLSLAFASTGALRWESLRRGVSVPQCAPSMPLDEYHRKRKFGRTPEPEGKAPRKHRRAAGLRFVVQKHAARRLHYDFRLELEGVLKSWAVPKGPCLDPTEKRLAVEVEDHPLEYGEFEGTIPRGEYGGGAVLLWDRGTWSPEAADPVVAFREGMLKFRLEGEKLRGRWMLVRMKPRADEKANNWLLVKERDDEARPLASLDVLDERPESVVSGRTIDEVAADRAGTGTPQSPGQPRDAARTGSRSKYGRSGTETVRLKLSPAKIARAVAAPFPTSIAPQLAASADTPPQGERWLHEIKFDGYRLLAFLNEGKVTLRTRNNLDWTRRFPELAQAVAALPVRQAVLDGEVVSLLPHGASSFTGLQEALSRGETGPLVDFVFDLLYLDGYDLRRTPLHERKRLLAEVIAAAGQTRLQYTDHLTGDGAEFFRQCRGMGLEGILSKRGDRPYTSGRSDDWLKVKCVQRDEFVIGGFTSSTAAHRGLRALLVGTFNPAGELIYAGKVGTGFTEEMLTPLRERLMARQQDASPFADLAAHEVERGTRWVRPELVAQVEYANRSRDGLLRHPVFHGLREDKPAPEVVAVAAEPSICRAASKDARRSKAAIEKVGPRRGAPLERDQLRALEGVRFTHPERMLYPESGITKLGLASFYAEIADWILPHVSGRLLSLVRCPDGVGGKQFFQKHATAGMSDAIHRVPVAEKHATETHLMIDDLAGLLSLVQMSILEIHVWGSRIDEPDRPDRIVFDLDPDPSVAWPQVVEAAHEVRSRLAQLPLVSFVKTTGGKGLHVVVPIQRRNTWDEVKQFAKRFAERMASDSRQKYTATMFKAARTGKIYIDYLRNVRGATAVAPYSIRAQPGATVSTPLDWKELTAALHADEFHVGNLRDRLASLQHDPWEGIATVRQSLTAAIRRKLGV